MLYPFFWLRQVNPSMLLVVFGSIIATQFMNLTLAIMLRAKRRHYQPQTPPKKPKKKKHWIINELITN